MKKITYTEIATGTARKCFKCQQPATKFGFTSDVRGGKDKSSRTPLCEAHVPVVQS